MNDLYSAIADTRSIYEHIFLGTPDAILIADKSGSIRLANEQCARLFGYDIATLHRLKIEHLLPDRLRSVHMHHRRRYFAAPTPRPMGLNQILLARHSDGSEIPVEISLSPLGFDGESMVCATIRNVAELRRAQSALQRAMRAEAIAEFGYHAIQTHNGAELNRKACQLVVEHLHASHVMIGRLDPTCDELLPDAGGRHGPAYPPEILTQIVERLRNAGRGGHTPICWLDGRPDGDEDLRALLREAGLHAAFCCPIPGNNDGSALIIAASDREGSFPREEIPFVQSIANTLAASRARRFTEEQLFQSQRLEALGQLTGGVAHDFNNLLTVVSGNLQILEERVAADASLRALIRPAMRATMRGADLTRKLLAFARRQTLQPRGIAVDSWLVSMAEILGRTLGPNIEVITHCEPNLPHALADPGMLDTSLLNLAVNARDAMPEGGRLVLEASAAGIDAEYAARELELRPGRYIMVAISDTGCGMPESVLNRAFEPFFTTKEMGKGSGLGLSLVYGFAKQSGGHLKVYSTEGLGTTVNLYLPAIERSTESTAPAPTSAAVGGDETVLVVEDDNEVRGVAMQFLEQLGYTALYAADADQAVDTLLAHPEIDLLFTDVVLKGSANGVELARRALRERPKLKVLLTSGYAPHALPLGDALTQGIELISKPYRLEQLARMLRNALSKR
jgi:PAS domain S-box-containing protein